VAVRGSKGFQTHFVDDGYFVKGLILIVARPLLSSKLHGSAIILNSDSSKFSLPMVL